MASARKYHAHWWESMAETSVLVSVAEMSDYFLSLDPVAKERYKEKLRIVGLDENYDPYIDDGTYVDDMTLWPSVEYGHIFCYFIERPGVYTKQELMQWKSLDASGHVRLVTVKRVNPTTRVLKALVNPSQSSPDKAHEAWVAAKIDGEILAAHCKCMAGLGEGCSHVAAIMFKVDSAVKNGYTSVTSSTCRWNQIFSTKHEPSRILDIDFRQLKYAVEKAEPAPKKYRAISTPSTLEQKAFIETLCSLEPKATILTATTLQDPPSTTRCNIIPRKLPQTVMSMIHPNSKLKDDELQEECTRVMNSIRVTREEADYLAAATTLQSECLLWFQHRKGRITASYFSQVFHTKLDPPSESLLSKLLQEKPTPTIPALQWGKEREKGAREFYFSNIKDDHLDFSIELTGLHVNPSFPHLGASPDGIISCTCCGEGLLEIKCPYSKRDMDLQEAAKEKGFYLEHTSNGMKLLHTHQYYYQIQGQLAVCDYTYCDFVCWTTRGMHWERIYFDPTFFDNIKPKLDVYFRTIMLPRMIRGKPGQSKQESEDIWCFCRQGEYGKMIECDNPSCKYKWFHFKCVNVKVAPKGNWFCSICIKL